MDSIDLQALVRTFKKLEGVEIYGYITSKLPRPTNLLQSCTVEDNGFFVRMDVLAVNLSRYKQYLKDCGITNKENNDIYLVNGSVALYVDSRGIYPDWYAVRGTLRLGSHADSHYLVMFPFIKKGSSWSIGKNTLDTMEISGWGRNSRLYASVQESLRNGRVTVPPDVQQYPKFSHRMTTNQNIIVHQQSANQAQSEVASTSELATMQSTESSFKPQDRDKVKEPNEMYKILQDKLEKIKSSSKTIMESLKNEYALQEDSVDSHVEYLVKSLKANLKGKPSVSSSTGRVLLTKYLKDFSGYANESYLNTTVGKFLIERFYEVAEYILDSEREINAGGKALLLCRNAFGDREQFYARMLGVLLGINTERLVSICTTCTDNDLSFVKIATTNPYIFLVLSSDLSYKDVDYMAYCLGLCNKKEITRFKLIGIIYDYLNNSSDGDTVYKVSDLFKSCLGVVLTKAKYNQCMTSGTYLSETVRSNIYYYLDNTLTRASYMYPSSGWRNKGYSYILPLSRNELELGVNLIIQYGLALTFERDGEVWIASKEYVNRELFICQTMLDLATSNGYNHAEIDKYIDEYENLVGFKLEEKQRQAVHLIDSNVGVITGSAGSGKTTVSECMVYVLNKFDVTNIQYAAPTGKAAKRLQEVVKQPCQTFNSKFKIFGNSSGILSKEDASASEEGVVYFFDEVAMTNVDLMYRVCQNLSNCSVYLFGDICQLPPIGKGLPFKNLLRYLPCVVLNVTKRSAENSGITYNAKVINEGSNSDNWQPLKEFDDFKMISCANDSIKRITVLLCKYHLHKISDIELKELQSLIGQSSDKLIRLSDITADDIQVVSPLGKPTYDWGTYQLNLELQSVFNPVRGYDKTFKYQASERSVGTKFILGDRVIHTDANMYSMQWYSSYEGGTLTKRYGFGIANGDVGKVVAFYPSNTCTIEDEVDDKPDDFKYPENLRDDTTFIDDKNWFIIVEYYDFMSDSNFYIVYRATLNTFIQDNECRVFTGEDLTKLNLFYAGTTHKMQGSQAKLIIDIFGSVSFNGFLTRNMLYTGITRASEGVYLLGSVSNNPNSQLSKARKEVAEDGVSTIQEFMFTGD